MRRWLCRRKFLATVIFCGISTVIFVSLIPAHSRLGGDHQNNPSNQKLKTALKAVESLPLLQDKDQRYVVYNRVPKCGSMSMTTVCYRAGGANGFRVASPYEDGEKPGKSEEEQAKFVNYLHQQVHGYLYIRHQYFIDFTRFGEKQPIYINIIRDPVARFESFYYFSRFGNERGGGASARMSDERREESIDECIQKRRQECIKPYWQMVPYFCGQEPGCMSRSQWAVDKAKDNIKRHYVFVGTLENLDVSLRILEEILPTYFKNAEKIYHNPENDRMKHETHTRHKKETSEAAKEFLRTETSLKLEYDLYYFVQSRLKELQNTLL